MDITLRLQTLMMFQLMQMMAIKILQLLESKTSDIFKAPVNQLSKQHKGRQV